MWEVGQACQWEDEVYEVERHVQVDCTDNVFERSYDSLSVLLYYILGHVFEVWGICARHERSVCTEVMIDCR